MQFSLRIAKRFRRLVATFLAPSVIVGLIVGSSLLGTTAIADGILETIALSGTQAPGTASGVTFSRFPVELTTQHFVPPSINAQGQVTFYGNLAGPNVIFQGNDLGLWSGTSGNVSLVARINELNPLNAPPTIASFVPPGGFSTPPLNPVPMNTNGQLAFEAFLAGQGVNPQNDAGLWSGLATSPTMFAREGDTPAGFAPPTKYAPGTSFGAPFINDAGQVAFITALTPGNVSILVGSPAAPQIIAQVGQQAAGVANGIIYAAQSSGGALPAYVFNPQALSSNGQVAFTAALSGPGVNFFNAGGIWAGTAGNVNLVARGGDQAPGMASGVEFLSPSATFGANPFSSVEVNGAGQVAFASTTSNQSLSIAGSGIWAGTPGNLALVAAGGAPAPGTASGTIFSSDAFTAAASNPAFMAPLQNAQGKIAFTAFVDRPGLGMHSGLGLWAGLPGQLSLVAQSGQSAPGAPGLTFESVLSPLPTYYPTVGMNSAGQVAFVGELSNQSTGIWGTDRSGQLREVVRVGEQIAPGDFRVITNLAFLGGSGNADGRPNGLSDNGQIAFWAALSDGSTGMFVSNALAVPEPSTFLLVTTGAGLLLMVAGRRRNRR